MSARTGHTSYVRRYEPIHEINQSFNCDIVETEIRVVLRKSSYNRISRQ